MLLVLECYSGDNYHTKSNIPLEKFNNARASYFFDKNDVALALIDTTIFGSAKNATFFIAYCGGQTRAQTVLNGLNHLLEQGAVPRDWVLVHDAARCLITPAQITALMVACENDPVGGLLEHRLADTLKQASGDRIAATLERSDKWLAQTPQMFRIGMLRGALAQATDQVTDEASAIEALGHAPLLVPGGAQNFKVTYPDDFALAEAVLQQRNNT